MTEQENNATTPTTETKAEDVFKVFVGNIAFKTTNEQLKEFFKPSGDVKDANIINRRGKSLGYGFVSFATEAEANKAVEEFNKKELDGRQINVEIAKTKNPEERRSFRGGRRGYRGRGYRGRGYRRRGGYRGGYRGRRDDGDDGRPRYRGRGYRGRGRGRGRFYRRGGRNFRYRTRRPQPPTGETSETTIYVANLPFKLDDEELKKAFSNYNIESAKVIRYRSGRSKGFGFIKAKTQEDQQKILNEVNELEIDGRKLIIKIALASQQPREEAKAETPAQE
ncbi:RNA-binding domain-containing protein [Anaeromyces robustus]|jgi:RNA recognition motif-containing protein|uniref:RNA-binding domain-containing protein n=1 Tax=Anaeromyces robustus TaxID=1754192 RepID=A0A1Y1XQ97_9FUNG|nr:RNA-binding domain-containing protein [Anaeromyces robustus]|eukprot:ORX87929.1 RNA-binding domain-containing protein [Anaeromyces robustus]